MSLRREAELPFVHFLKRPLLQPAQCGLGGRSRKPSSLFLLLSAAAAAATVNYFRAISTIVVGEEAGEGRGRTVLRHHALEREPLACCFPPWGRRTTTHTHTTYGDFHYVIGPSPLSLLSSAAIFYDETCSPFPPFVPSINIAISGLRSPPLQTGTQTTHAS